MSDHRILVGGGEVPDPHARPSETRGVGMALLAAVALVIGLAFFDFDPPSSEEPTKPAPLVAPQAVPAPVRASATIPAIARGWQRLDLPGRSTVVNLAHGGGLWMALAQGDVSTVSTSQDARVWLTRTFPGSLDGEVRSLVSESALVVVDSDVSSGGKTRSWVSGDGGVSWETTLFGPGLVRVDTLADAGSRLLAGGVYATGPTALNDADGVTTAAVWELVDGAWSPIRFADLSGGNSSVSGLASGPDGVFAFGRAGGQPAAWRLVGSVFRPEPISVPGQAGGGAFATVTQSLDGWWLAEFDTNSAVVYARSTDLREWTFLASGFDWSRSISTAAFSLGIVQIVDDDVYRVIGLAGVDEVRYRYPNIATGFDAERHTVAVASDGGRIVMAGGRRSAALWVWGSDGMGVGVTAAPPSTGARWVTTQSFGGGSWKEGPEPFQIVSADDGFVVATPQGMWRTPDPVSGTLVREDLVAGGVISSSRGLFAIDADDRLWRDAGDGRWLREDLGISVAGITETSWALLAHGWDAEGNPAIALRADGDAWQLVSIGASVYPVAAVGGMILGFDASRRAETEASSTVDGVNWSEIKIDIDSLGGTQAGIPFLVSGYGSDSTTFELLDDSGITVEVPSIDPLEVVTVGSILRVRGPDGLWETTDNGVTWTSYPIGVEYRLTGAIRLVPTEQPMLLMAGRGSYQFFIFEQ
jgi:hypothetical protein